MHMPCRPIHRMIEDQVRRWEALGETHARSFMAQPVIAISRLPGCAGRAVAEELARLMGFALFDRELIDRVAERAHLSADEVCALDEKGRSMLEEFVDSLIRQRYAGEDYFRHLCRTVLAIAKRGRAVILGRGASFILPPRTCLRVLLVAPLPARVASLSRRLGLGPEEARRRILQVEADRRAFILKHFHRDLTDPTAYDLTLNTEEAGGTDTVDAIRLAWSMKCELRRAPEPALR
ncbi:MAG: cytidylate kinase-like family protein [Elusimicrobia bacterium]|nr:cytidylate kinase-like family protein [Elusimicrobiota bacterium]